MTGPVVPRPDTAIALSLVAGILMIISGLFILGIGAFSLFGSVFGWVGIVSGILVIVGAAMLQARPDQSSNWGVIILIFSILSLFGAGGFIAGLILGIIGGAMAMSWKPFGGYPTLPYPYPGYPVPGYPPSGYPGPYPMPPVVPPSPPGVPGIVAPSAGERRCKTCGNPVGADAVFCARCGTKL